MFDLEQEIVEWRRAMVAGGVTDPAVLDELESHLRDHVEQQVRSGGDAGQAFQAGVARIGPPGVLQREFLRAEKTLSASRPAAFLDDRRRCRWLALGLAALVATGFYVWNARVTPIYASVATVQLLRPLPPGSVVARESAPEQDVRFAEILNTTLKLLASDRLRAKVADSMTPAERVILFRPAVLRRGAPGYSPRWIGEWLGTLSVWPQRLSGTVTVSVRHEDPEAAALVANRYAQQLRAEFAGGTDFQGISVRQIDVAMPRRDPVSPNLWHILVASLWLAVGTFIVLTALAALGRRLIRSRPGLGPQLKVE